MSDGTYIVLRKRLVSGSNPQVLSRGMERSGLEIASVAADIETMSDNEAEELRRDPNVFASAPSVPVALIAPVAAAASATSRDVDAARAAGASWGVDTVAAGIGSDAGSKITVAVLDTGIDPRHPAFLGVELTTKNFSRSPAEEDINGHGTHCAGTIFGRDVDGVRIGVARGVRRALIGKVLDDDGRGDSARIVQAIRWAQEQGARVISISIGIDFPKLVNALIQQGKAPAEAASRALAAYRDTVRVFDGLMHLVDVQDALFGTSAVVVAAAGNESAREGSSPYVLDVSLPAAATGVISVGAVERSAGGTKIAGFSNVNPMLCAPGVGIVSGKSGGGLTAMSGTSMAAPHVSGLCVLWWEKVLADNPRARSELVRSSLLANCRSNGFAPGVTPADRGAGLATAPSYQ